MKNLPKSGEAHAREVRFVRSMPTGGVFLTVLLLSLIGCEQLQTKASPASDNGRIPRFLDFRTLFKRLQSGKQQPSG